MSLPPIYEQWIVKIHATPTQIVLATAGGGSQAIAQLLAVPGASRTLIEARVPYHKEAFSQFVGAEPEKFVSAEAARQLAGAAYRYGRQLADPDIPVVGVAGTAALVTDRPKKGSHRAYLALWQPDSVETCYLELTKGARKRHEEELMMSQALLNLVGLAVGLSDPPALPLLPNDRWSVTVLAVGQMVENWLATETPAFGLAATGSLTKVQPPLLLSGSFNPLHEGHQKLALAAAEFVGKPAAFELAVVNADKPALPVATILERMSQFAGRWPIWISRAPTYNLKAKVYPGTDFVVGWDTAVRILEPRFYGGTMAGVLDALTVIKENGCRLIVAGRVDGQGNYQPADNLDVPAGFEELFVPLPHFRVDLSSTELREGRG
ncbi:MAG TPA: hypothetical protein VLL52_06175 [Anaerolineae bacterium]|nr:hypothetical protein [Anaerolineae bacterium]